MVVVIAAKYQKIPDLLAPHALVKKLDTIEVFMRLFPNKIMKEALSTKVAKGSFVWLELTAEEASIALDWLLLQPFQSDVFKVSNPERGDADPLAFSLMERFAVPELPPEDILKLANGEPLTALTSGTGTTFLGQPSASSAWDESDDNLMDA